MRGSRFREPEARRRCARKARIFRAKNKNPLNVKKDKTKVPPNRTRARTLDFSQMHKRGLNAWILDEVFEDE